AGTGLRREQFATLVHPAAGVSSRARLGHGVSINYGVSVAGNVTIGDHVSLGAACVVGHDSVIEAFTMLDPAPVVICLVHVGDAAVRRQRVRVGARALIGMGAVVLKDVVEGTVVVGNPARPLERPAVTAKAG